MKKFTKSQLLSVALDCYAKYHKENHCPCNKFFVDDTATDTVRIVPSLANGYNYFPADVITFIVDYLNKVGIPYRVKPSGIKVVISLRQYE